MLSLTTPLPFPLSQGSCLMKDIKVKCYLLHIFCTETIQGRIQIKAEPMLPIHKSFVTAVEEALHRSGEATFILASVCFKMLCSGNMYKVPLKNQIMVSNPVRNWLCGGWGWSLRLKLEKLAVNHPSNLRMTRGGILHQSLRRQCWEMYLFFIIGSREKVGT